MYGTQCCSLASCSTSSSSQCHGERQKSPVTERTAELPEKSQHKFISLGELGGAHIPEKCTSPTASLERKVKVSPQKCSTTGSKKQKQKGKTVKITKDMIEKRIEEIEKEKQKEKNLPLLPPAPVPEALSTVKLEGVKKDLHSKYSAQLQQTAKLQHEMQLLQAKIEGHVTTTEATKTEIQIAFEKNNKLQDVCRELQKQNQSILAVVQGRGEEEQIKRKQLSEAFTKTINEITATMEAHTQERLKIVQQNDELQALIQTLKDEIIARDEQMKKLNAEKDEESMKTEASLKKIEEDIREDEKRFNALRREIEQQNDSELLIKDRILQCNNKIARMQDTFTQSNPIFQLYRSEMDLLSSQVKATERENTDLIVQFLKNDYQINCLHEEICGLKARSVILSGENNSLTQLCKMLSAQRSFNRNSALSAGTAIAAVSSCSSQD